MKYQIVHIYILNSQTIKRLGLFLLCFGQNIQMFSAHIWSAASRIRLQFHCKLPRLAAERSQPGMFEPDTDSQIVNYTIPCSGVVIFTTSASVYMLSDYKALVPRPKQSYNIPQMSDLEVWDSSLWFGGMRLECFVRKFTASQFHGSESEQHK